MALDEALRDLVHDGDGLLLGRQPRVRGLKTALAEATA
jgi:hypothetical protein